MLERYGLDRFPDVVSAYQVYTDVEETFMESSERAREQRRHEMIALFTATMANVHGPLPEIVPVTVVNVESVSRRDRTTCECYFLPRTREVYRASRAQVGETYLPSSPDFVGLESARETWRTYFAALPQSHPSIFDGDRFLTLIERLCQLALLMEDSQRFSTLLSEIKRYEEDYDARVEELEETMVQELERAAQHLWSTLCQVLTTMAPNAVIPSQIKISPYPNWWRDEILVYVPHAPQSLRQAPVRRQRILWWSRTLINYATATPATSKRWRAEAQYIPRAMFDVMAPLIRRHARHR